MTAFFSKASRLKFHHKILIIFFIGLLCFGSYFTWVFLTLPKLFEMGDYQPPLMTEVYDREGKKVGEFFKERRLLFPYESVPKSVVQAFVAAEDGRFFSHKGLNYRAIARAFLANLKAGKKVQGGSTITQQLARTLLLSKEKTYTRKFKEAVLALRMESSLSKQDILHIYLNQIYLGHGAYGLETASRTYFRKSAKELTVAEAALLAGLPKAPSRFSPVYRPDRAKSRQLYVLNRMRREGYLSEEEMNKYANQDIRVFLRRDFSEESPYYLETVRRILLLHLESKDLLESGLKVWTAMDRGKQQSARKALRKGLEDWDKRRGFRGVQKNLSTEEERRAFTKERDKKLRSQIKKHLTIPGFTLILQGEEEIPESFFAEFKEKFRSIEKKQLSKDYWFENRARLEGKIFPAFISKVSEKAIEVAAPWGLESLALEDFQWAVPIEKKPEQSLLSHPSEIFKVHDLVSFRVKPLDEEGPDFDKSRIPLDLYQEPPAEGSLLSFDLENSEISALVGGYDYSRSQYNRAYQSRRQAGSVFKPLVYGAALERGFHPTSLISDSPVVFSKKEAEEKKAEDQEEDPSLQDMWRPSNISNRFSGDILFRKALIRSLNVPTVRITEKIGLNWIRFYARRLGIFSPLNSDFTMALGSSSLNLYEVLKAFSLIANQGKALTPLLIHRVEDSEGREILSNLSLDEFFKEEIAKSQEFVQKEKTKWFKDNIPETERSLFQKRWSDLLKKDSIQKIPPSNSYVLMNLLESIVEDSEGTARRARVLDRPVGGKTGTTDGYYDTWFVGASPFFSAAVWIGFDSEKTLGPGETGSRTALPVWIEYMEESHKDLPKAGFPIPENVVFSNIDPETGALVSSKSKEVIHQAFIEGFEPRELSSKSSPAGEDPFSPDETDFIREDLAR